MVQLFGHPSAPWPWDRARALWTAFGIFMPFVFDLSLAKAKENDSDLSLSLSFFFFFFFFEAGRQLFKPFFNEFE